MIEFGVDDEGVPHICQEGEESRHKIDSLCGCNPDWANGEGYDVPSEADKIGWWIHWSLGPGP